MKSERGPSGPHFFARRAGKSAPEGARSKAALGLMALAVLGASDLAFAQDNGGAYSRRFERASAALETGACAEALPEASAIVADRRFPDQEQAKRRTFLSALGVCALRDNQAELAFQAAERAVQIQPDELWAQLTRMSFGRRLGQPRIGVDAFYVIARLYPDQARNMEFGEVMEIVHAAQSMDSSGATALDVRRKLAALNYAPQNSGERDEWLRLERMLGNSARGRGAEPSN